MDAQSQHLIQMLDLIVKCLHPSKSEKITLAVVDLAKRHLQYGVAPAHYPVVGEVLLKVIAAALQASPKPLTQEEAIAWGKAYNKVSCLMSLPAESQSSVISQAKIFLKEYSELDSVADTNAREKVKTRLKQVPLPYLFRIIV